LSSIAESRSKYLSGVNSVNIMHGIKRNPWIPNIIYQGNALLATSEAMIYPMKYEKKGESIIIDNHDYF